MSWSEAVTNSISSSPLQVPFEVSERFATSLYQIGITAEYNVIELEAHAYDITIDYNITNLSLGFRYYLE